MGNLFNAILIQPIVNVLLLFYHGFLAIHLPYAFGFSIVALNILVRLILHPFFHKQMQMSFKMAEIKPHMDRLSKLHAQDKKKLQEEQMKLYKEMGVNPASGCLLALVQLPVFIGLYQVLSLFTANGGKQITNVIANINHLAYSSFLHVTTLDPHFFGINLWVNPAQFQKFGYFYLLFPLITAALQFWQISLSTPKQPPALAVVEKDTKKNKDSKDEKKEDMQQAMATQMKFITPLMIGYFSFRLPVGLSLYYNIFSLFSIAQYLMYNRNLKKAELAKK